MRKTMLYALAAVLLSSQTLLAQQPVRQWTLSECIDYALEHNLTVKQSENTLQQREIELNTAVNSRLPDLSASASENLSFGRGLTSDNTYANTNTTSSSFSLGASLPVFQGFRIKSNIDLCRFSLAAATADLEKARDDIRVSVAQAYVQILYNMEIVDVAKSQVDIDAQQVSRLEELERSGKASGSEVSAQRATLAQSRLTLTQAEGNLSIAILDLTQLLELPSPDDFGIVRPDATSFEPALLLNPEQIYAYAVEIKPVVKSEVLRLDQAKKNIALAKSSFLPTLSLSGGVGTNYYTSSGFDHDKLFTQLSNNFSQYVGLSLSVPIFSRFSNRNQLRVAELSRDSQAIQLESVKKSLYKEIQQAYYNAVNARDKYESSQAAALSAQDAFTLMQAKYENGKANVTEFNESKNRYMSAESDLVKARYEYLFQSRLLDFYKGDSIAF